MALAHLFRSWCWVLEWIRKRGEGRETGSLLFAKRKRWLSHLHYMTPQSILTTFSMPSYQAIISSVSASSILVSSPCDCVEPSGIGQTLLVLRSENARLHEETARLKEVNASLTLDARFREEELNKYKSDYYSERFKSNVRKRLSRSAERKYAAQAMKLKQAERVISSMIDIGLHIPVLHTSFASGTSPDRALADTTHQGAARSRTAGFRFIPPVKGLQTYTADIGVITKNTEHSKTSKIHRKTNDRQNPCQHNIITPSPSQLADASTKSPNECKANAVDDLLQQLKDGVHPAKAVFLSNELVSMMSATPAPLLAPPTSSRVQDQTLSATRSQVISHDLSYHRAPPSKSLRPAFEELDLNIPHTPKRRSSRKSFGNPSKTTQGGAYNEHDHLDLMPNVIQPLGHSQHLCLQTALLSLERICAAFSSTSLGSLSVTSNEPSRERPTSPVTGDVSCLNRSIIQYPGFTTSLKTTKVAAAFPKFKMELLSKVSSNPPSCKATNRSGHSSSKLKLAKLRKVLSFQNMPALRLAQNFSTKNRLPQPDHALPILSALSSEKAVVGKGLPKREIY